ncbi:glycoside hydrolase family 15 protein [Aureimonas frigidaquae]|uniref:glycoside hydrolase family 15 protein n=1 Tax=Aureimonas frigidaquae TaxID=424757 RepID=UPI0009FB4321|nr:glycoside hydrolase family 15 protein [Aureimonas frigidaquae]
MTEPKARQARNRISEHGIIGDMRTTALVAMDGTIDFFCYPHFDSPTLFGHLLGEDMGEFRLHVPGCGGATRQIYLPDTNILLTRFLGDGSIGEVSDFMPVDESGRIVRRAKAVLGTVTFQLLITPRPDYGRAAISMEPVEGGVHLTWTQAGKDHSAFFYSDRPLALEADGIHGQWTLEEGQTLHVVFCPGRIGHPRIDKEYVRRSFADTSHFWHGWVGEGTYPNNWKELVTRSALTLKLLTSRDHGSIAAAATFGLPEVLGGERNWDYRFCWVRDSAFTLYAFSRLNYYDEAEAFIHFLMERVMEEPEDGPGLQIMYAMNGEDDLTERELDHVPGYEGSRPVRIGNEAYTQRQMDIFGEFMDAVYISTKARGKPTTSAWRKMASMLDWVAANWRLKDKGIWESRGEDEEYLSSRLMCWVALDRGLRIAMRQSLPCDMDLWRVERDRIQETILTEFWNPDVGAFTQTKGGTAVDAVVLLMPLVRFINPRDPLWTSTLRVVQEKLVHDCLVKRYDNAEASFDGLEGEEGTFTICSFWYVEALARTGQVAEARLMFEKLHSYANHLGLYAEELSSAGDHLGNFPQGLTHLSLISAAIWLDRALSQSRTGGTHNHILEDPDGIA